jgi:hypothetical protein
MCPVRGILGEGVAQIDDDSGPKPGKRTMQAEYHIGQVSIDMSGTATRVKLDGFSLALVGGGRAQLKTDVTLADGEKVVVGTSTVQDNRARRASVRPRDPVTGARSDLLKAAGLPGRGRKLQHPALLRYPVIDLSVTAG